MTFTPKIKVEVRHYPGYGSPPTWELKAVFENTLLEERLCGSEMEAGKQSALLESKWGIEYPDEPAFRKQIEARPLFSPLCSVCGQPTKDNGGPTSCMDKMFCQRDSCKAELNRQIADSTAREAARAERWAKEDAERTNARCADARRGFHAFDDWYFLPLADGEVRITKASQYGASAQITLDANTWCSIIAGVSATGETGDQWQRAREFHGAAWATPSPRGTPE